MKLGYTIIYVPNVDASLSFFERSLRIETLGFTRSRFIFCKTNVYFKPWIVREQLLFL